MFAQRQSSPASFALVFPDSSSFSRSASLLPRRQKFKGKTSREFFSPRSRCIRARKWLVVGYRDIDLPSGNLRVKNLRVLRFTIPLVIHIRLLSVKIRGSLRARIIVEFIGTPRRMRLREWFSFAESRDYGSRVSKNRKAHIKIGNDSRHNSSNGGCTPLLYKSWCIKHFRISDVIYNSHTSIPASFIWCLSCATYRCVH